MMMAKAVAENSYIVQWQRYDRTPAISLCDTACGSNDSRAGCGSWQQLLWLAYGGSYS
jgi:hypothetical protein